VVINSTEPLDDFTLTASTGEEVRLSDFRDRITLLYYGYTYCPDICPATLAALSDAMERLDPGEREQVQVLMISVDPERDTPELLSKYLAHFDPSFLGLTGTVSEIATAAKSAGIYYQKREGTVDTGYLVDHTATVVALDKDGRIRLTYAFNTPGEEIAADLHQLLKE
jgi:protein SCO1/2